MKNTHEIEFVSKFSRKFYELKENFFCIGEGSLGGKAKGLAFIKNIIQTKIDSNEFPQIDISIPRLVVLCTDIFDTFLERNNLYETAYSTNNDVKIISEFLEADLPVEILGDLRTLIEHINVPLAIRSSSMLEDSKYEPFAGIFATKMIPNNQPNTDIRFHKLIEAIKFVYASTFFKASKDYFKASKHKIEEEKMAVIIQEVVGENHNFRYYPNISGVAKSYNYYPTGKQKPENGIINLALGLGKTIVDGGIVWSYSPIYPKSPPPFGDPQDIMKTTQYNFWSINMNPIVNYDPTKETEYLLNLNLSDADYDNTLNTIASTYDSNSNKIVMGVGIDGPRIINFSQLLHMNEFGFNNFMKKIIQVCEESFNSPVEIEFAITINKQIQRLFFGFLQVRPMVVSDEIVEIDDNELLDESNLVASDRAMGNGTIDSIVDVVYVKPDNFDKKNTTVIAAEIEKINRVLVESGAQYLLIGFGRWGSSDPWLGIPVEWGQIAGAKVIVESTLFGINVDLSQGSHFFHNLTSFNVCYFSINYDGKFKIAWDWLNEQRVVAETEFVKHIKLQLPLIVKVDGRTGKGVIKKC
ncbi:MAG: PEP/pyruvate-binding domain-containing protein [Bacteroidota bacterium]